MRTSLALCVLQGAVLVASLTSGPADDFSHHEVVRPVLIHNREKRHLNSTRIKDDSSSNQNNHVHDLAVEINFGGKDVVLDLKLNRELIPKEYFVRHQGVPPQILRPSAEEIDLCEYKGTIRGKPNSWAAISTCNGLSGIIFDGEEMHYIEPKSKNGGSNDDHFVYRHSNLQTNHTCGFPDTPHHIHEPAALNRFKRSVGEGHSGVIRAPYSSNKQTRYVELVFVVDNKEFKELGTVEAVSSHCKKIANIINSLYSPLNIFIALVGVVVWTEHDEINITSNGDTTLSNFLHYRRGKLAKEHPNDNAQLLTRMQFDGGVVGKALKGPICTYEFSGGISVDHSNAVGLVATTVAHEMGHNFGMEHDTSDCKCPTDRCIMAPSSNSRLFTHWSDCSLSYLAHAFEHGMDYCLRNKPDKLFESPVCGNDFVEPGEQCDCGLPEQCDNPCCNASTCMLHLNATCATGKCCDLDTCRPKRAGTECRTADHECDLPEFCSGESEYCPDNFFKMDGEQCDKSKAFCFQGTCRTHSDQCKLLWGPSGVNSESKCYQDMNIKGTQHGNCGYNRLNHSYIKCGGGDVMCGMLHCKHLNERLEFGMESVAILSQTFLNSGGDIIACRNAIVDLGLNEVDPGLAPDGAKCGDGKMCVNQKCMAVDSLKMSSCANNCNGNGICNSKAQCHCDVGYAPPDCNSAGFGGSLLSGPASDPNGTSGLQIMLILMLAVCLMVLVLFFAAYMAHRWRTKRSPPPESSAHSKAADLSRLKEAISRPMPQVVGDSAQASLLTATEQLNSLIAQHKVAPPPSAPPAPVLVPIRAPPPKPLSPPGAPPEAAAGDAPRGYLPVAGDSPTNHGGGPLDPPPVKVVRDGGGSTLSRIASILKPLPHAPPTAPVQARGNKPKINRENLRSLHISEPIPLQNIEVPGVTVVAGGDSIGVPRPVVMRTHSMRDPVAPKAAPLASFGSMRAKRPTSITGARPSAPPPPRPPSLKEPLQYDDCGPPGPMGAAPLAHIDEENSPTSADNIYAVIEDCSPSPPLKKGNKQSPQEYTTPTGEYQFPKPADNTVSAGSVESVGLLSEIVSEMQARNIESIYTTGGAKDDDKNRCPSSLSGSQSSGTYVNALYTNLGGSPTPSQASSNQYLRPSAIVPPPVPAESAPPVAAPFSTFRPSPGAPKLGNGKKVEISAPMLITGGAAKPKEVKFAGLKSPGEEKKGVKMGKLVAKNDAVKPKPVITNKEPPKSAKAAFMDSKPAESKAPPPPKADSKPRLVISNPTLISSSNTPATAAKPAAVKAPNPAVVRSVLAAVESSKMAQRPLPEKPTTATKVPPPTAARKVVVGRPGPDLLAACAEQRPAANRGPDVLDKPKQPPPPPSRVSNVAALQHKFESRAK